jgi:hypothetical protein
MSWLSLLFDASYVVRVVVGVTVLFCVLPAYKRTRNRAFLYLTFAYMLSIFLAVCDHTIGLWDMSQRERVPYRTLLWFAYFADGILAAIGIILLTRSYFSAIGKTGEGKPTV